MLGIESSTLTYAKTASHMNAMSMEDAMAVFTTMASDSRRGEGCE